MPRATAAAVAAIVEVEDGDDVDPFIELADVMVNENACVIESAYSEAKLTKLEILLSAHLYSILRPAFRRQRGPEGTEEEIESKVDLGLNVTRYGQQVSLLDTNGCLAAAVNDAETTTRKARLIIRWLGTPHEDR